MTVLNTLNPLSDAFQPSLFALALLVLSFALLGVNFFFRARAMQRLAAEWDLNYLGPAFMPKYFDWTQKSHPRLPFRIHDIFPMWRRWNVIDGHINGIRTEIFDALFWKFGYRLSVFATFVACQTDQSPFGENAESKGFFISNNLVHSNGWTVLYRSSLINLFTPWTISRRRLEERLGTIRAATTPEAQSAQRI